MAERPGGARRDRADRILDTARDLLLAWGYRRVTIDELARRAGVGKGTIYLHWRSREEVFHAVSAREAAEMADAIVDAVHHDPAEARAAPGDEKALPFEQVGPEHRATPSDCIGYVV